MLTWSGWNWSEPQDLGKMLNLRVSSNVRPALLAWGRMALISWADSGVPGINTFAFDVRSPHRYQTLGINPGTATSRPMLALSNGRLALMVTSGYEHSLALYDFHRGVGDAVNRPPGWSSRYCGVVPSGEPAIEGTRQGVIALLHVGECHYRCLYFHARIDRWVDVGSSGEVGLPSGASTAAMVRVGNTLLLVFRLEDDSLYWDYTPLPDDDDLTDAVTAGYRMTPRWWRQRVNQEMRRPKPLKSVRPSGIFNIGDRFPAFAAVGTPVLTSLAPAQSHIALMTWRSKRDGGRLRQAIYDGGGWSNEADVAMAGGRPLPVDADPAVALVDGRLVMVWPRNGRLMVSFAEHSPAAYWASNAIARECLWRPRPFKVAVPRDGEIHFPEVRTGWNNRGKEIVACATRPEHLDSIQQQMELIPAGSGGEFRIKLDGHFPTSSTGYSGAEAVADPEKSPKVTVGLRADGIALSHGKSLFALVDRGFAFEKSLPTRRQGLLTLDLNSERLLQGEHIALCMAGEGNRYLAANLNRQFRLDTKAVHWTTHKVNPLGVDETVFLQCGRAFLGKLPVDDKGRVLVDATLDPARALAVWPVVLDGNSFCLRTCDNHVVTVGPENPPVLSLLPFGQSPSGTVQRFRLHAGTVHAVQQDLFWLRCEGTGTVLSSDGDLVRMERQSDRGGQLWRIDGEGLHVPAHGTWLYRWGDHIICRSVSQPWRLSPEGLFADDTGLALTVTAEGKLQLAKHDPSNANHRWHLHAYPRAPKMGRNLLDDLPPFQPFALINIQSGKALASDETSLTLTDIPSNPDPTAAYAWTHHHGVVADRGGRVLESNGLKVGVAAAAQPLPPWQRWFMTGEQELLSRDGRDMLVSVIDDHSIMTDRHACNRKRQKWVILPLRGT